ncbi:MAG: hypothetical protein IIX95_00580 [Clostridiales bacterium]|nr:hypothetical protein [Clostridiales bacterium]
MSPRACEVLKSVDVIACEDTRVTGILLSQLGINGKRLIAYHEHNKAASGNGILELLKQFLICHSTLCGVLRLFLRLSY